mmetsp:Transcript_94904/g.267975  ORF Transcript_94904/g.267975 Transcript_94904/m.267975 type:complete len:446 (+) Transcript_94904:109-1446(+)
MPDAQKLEKLKERIAMVRRDTDKFRAEAASQLAELVRTRDLAEAEALETKAAFELTEASFCEAISAMGAERDAGCRRADELSREVENLRGRLTDCVERLYTLEGFQRTRVVASVPRPDAKQGAAPSTRSRASDTTIVREMRVAMEGRVLEKVGEIKGQLIKRVVALQASATKDELIWAHPPGPMGTAYKSVDLRGPFRVHYGFRGCRMTGLCPRAPPWLCFSITTMHQALDFICPDEDVVQCFVLALSRVCGSSPKQGCMHSHVAGRVRSRGHFISLKGWCKVEHGAALKGKPLLKALAEAARRAASSFVEETAVRDPSALDDRHGAATMGKRERAKLNLASRLTGTFGSGALRIFPRAGETWRFTGAIKEVDLYEDKAGKEWANVLKCRDAAGERLTVLVEELSADSAVPMIRVRGTGKLRYVHGWIPLTDERGAWLVEELKVA